MSVPTTTPAPVSVTILTRYPELKPVADGMEIDPMVTAASWSTGKGGFGRGRVGLLPTGASYAPRGEVGLPTPVRIPENGHVEIRMGSALLYEGVIIRPAGRTGFEMEGYGTWAARYRTLDYGGPGPVTSGIVAQQAIRAVPWWEPGQVDDAGISHEWAEFEGQKVFPILSQLGIEGNEEVEWMLRVYEDRVAHFTAKTPSAQPDITLTYDPDFVDAVPEFDRLDGIRIRYRDADGTESVWPEGGRFHLRDGADPGDAYLRLETLTGSGPVNTAIAVAMTTLAQRSRLQLRGTAIVTGWEHMTRRYGDTFELRGEGTGIIEGTTHDLMTGNTTLTLGEPSWFTPRGFVRDAATAIEALTLKRDPITGARWRW
jgi:hypothetical protein